MLYYLSLLTHTDQLAFFRLFGYLTFRSGAAVMTSLLIAFLINPALIAWLKKRQGKGQPIRSDGPQRHIVAKAGTPTMGGLLILIPWVASTLLWASLSNRYVWVVLMVTVSFGMLGFLDDYYKVTKRTADGLSGRSRLLIEFAVAFVATWAIMGIEAPALSGALAVPFIKTALLPLGLFFIIVGGFVITGAANAVNFTDGLDGLAIVPVMIAAATFTLIVYLVGNEKFSGYLQFPISTARASWRCSWPRWSARVWAFFGTTRRPPPSSWAIPVRCPWAARWVPSPSWPSMRSCWPSSAACSCSRPCR